ncbi:MAG: DegT/DnrJ/EryC1/StrS family aminotransferase [Proteobacteria bacterium]|nr:DegT/DnrJ/EryC1/StrS family aminotransferase [Pseudomonadota bacterium]
MSELAILGGTPVRTTPFRSSVFIDDDERTLISEVLEKREFSRFMGSPTEDIEKQLIMPSAEAVDYKSQYFTFLGGRMIRQFEADFSKKFHSPFSITVNSCTSALSTALGACNIGPGDEVITTCMSFNATAMSILMFNAIPVFADISPANYCIDPDKIRMAITDRTKAIIVVHLLGFPAHMEEIMKIADEKGLYVIEDCAQAPGTEYQGQMVGTFGHFGAYSFQETKNFMTGEGGMLVTSRPDLARKARLIRNHGESVPDSTWTDTDLINIVGMNFRMTELTAALGIAQLRKMDENNRTRKENTFYLCEKISHLPDLGVPVYHDGIVPHVIPFVYKTPKGGPHRDIVLDALRAEGIPVGSGYQRLMCDNPVFTRKIAYGGHNCPWSCHLYNRKRDYDPSEFTVATDLLKNRFIWFYHIGKPNEKADMDDAAKAFIKVFQNLDDLKTLSAPKGPKKYKW